jgi:tRNA(Ile)-lysidine synthase
MSIVQRIISDAALLGAFSPLERYPRAALAVSGGPDSMSLMHLASRWIEVIGRSPSSAAVLTVDHALRPESQQEARFVAAEAASLGFSHAILHWTGEKPESGIQAAARRARYGLLTDYCRTQDLSCLVTAHTEDDQAETFLMRLRRGSGLDGLAAMAVVSERGGVPLLRPLLGFSKARLVAYLRSQKLRYISDPSNENMAFERVRLRHAMKACARAGIARPALARAASRLGRAREALTSTAAGFLENEFRVTNLGQGQIGLDALHGLPAEIALRVLSQVLALVGGKEDAPRMAKVERVLGDLRAGKREAALGSCLLIASQGMLNLYREPGRMRLAAVPALPGNVCVWDGRFVLAFAEDTDPDVAVSPLGAAGWTLCRKSLKDRGPESTPNRLAALTTPALWKAGQLVAAPTLNYVNACAPSFSGALAIRLVPRLSHFLRPD